MENEANDYVIRVLSSPQEVPVGEWNALLAGQTHPGPFTRHEYLAALQDSGSATPRTGWAAQFMTLRRQGVLEAACPLYVKTHSYGEYVFDWSWANAYEQHGLPYYPKATVAVPFTPVPGTRLLARSDAARRALVRALVGWCSDQKLSSLHLLFLSDEDQRACQAEGLMLRHTVQFHWQNRAPAGGKFHSFDEFLGSLNQDKRKKIRQERRKVAEAGVVFRHARGTDIGPEDWAFFYRCYERTYLEHGNAPYLSPEFFEQMARTMPGNWLMFTAERNGQPIATSLIALHAQPAGGSSHSDAMMLPPKTAYGRYWGALERVDCLHFEACYYQPLQWCIEHGVASFEGGAQGEHKMARALLPVRTSSAHWLAHPAFAQAVERFLEREGQGIEEYVNELEQRSPLRQAPAAG